MAYAEYGVTPFNVVLNLQSFDVESGDNNIEEKKVLFDPENNLGEANTILCGGGISRLKINFSGYISKENYTVLLNDFKTQTINSFFFDGEGYTIVLTKLSFSYKIEDISGKYWFSASAISSDVGSF
jgi:hypothetical protein